MRPSVSEGHEINGQQRKGTGGMAARPAPASGGLIQPMEVGEPLLMGCCSAVKSCLHWTVDAGVALKVVDHSSACRERHHNIEKVSAMTCGKSQSSPDAGCLKKPT
ncbi:hypothetical protein D3C80_1847110 [compost metagenome]